MAQFNSLPKSPDRFMERSWEELRPYYQNLIDRPLDDESVSIWLSDWTSLIDTVIEIQARLTVEVTLDTKDKLKFGIIYNTQEL